MFGFQRLAMPMMPQTAVANALRCFITWEVCCDTGFSFVPVGCTGFSEQSQLCPFQQPNVGDPIEQLEQLRKQLAVTMAGLEAQERALREQAGGKKEQK